MKLHSFIIALLCAVSFASCDKEDTYPTFSFDANGECYIPDAANISTEEFESSVVGYGWKHVITHEIDSDGKCSTKDYYEDLIGGGPSQYYFESSESLKEYMYVDAFPAHGYHKYAYDYEDGNRISKNGHLVMRIVSLKGDIMKVIDYLGIRADGVNIYGYSTYKRMSSKELTEVKNAYPTDLSNIKSLTTSINDEVNIISGNEFEFDVLSYNDLYTVKAINEESCEITCNGDHVKIELITNGTLVPKAVLLDAMQAFGNVKVIIDNYGPQLSTQVSQAESAFASHGIFYETRKYFGKDAYYSGWLDMTDLADKHRTPADDAAVYASCIFSQHFQRCIIADGRIYICAVGRRLNELGVLKTNHDYLDLTDDKLTIRDKQKILQSFFERDSFESCHYCNGFCMDRPRYVPAEQLEKPLANDTSEKP